LVEAIYWSTHVAHSVAVMYNLWTPTILTNCSCIFTHCLCPHWKSSHLCTKRLRHQSHEQSETLPRLVMLTVSQKSTLVPSSELMRVATVHGRLDTVSSITTLVGSILKCSYVWITVNYSERLWESSDSITSIAESATFSGDSSPSIATIRSSASTSPL